MTEEYQNRTDQEIQELVAQIYGSFRGAHVAQAAPGFDVRGIWPCFSTKDRSGYATHAVAMSRMIDALKIPQQVIPHRYVDIDFGLFPEDRKDEYTKWVMGPVGIGELAIVSFPPAEASEMSEFGKLTVPYTVHEATSISRRAVDNCKVFADVWTVSEAATRAFAAGGVKARTIRPALATWNTPERTIDHATPFTFGVVGTWHARKGMLDLVRAYCGEFTRDENVRLIIRTSALGSRKTVTEFLAEVVAEVVAAREGLNQPKIEIITGTDCSDRELIEGVDPLAWEVLFAERQAKLLADPTLVLDPLPPKRDDDWLGLANLDAYVNPSYGEGLGIPHIWSLCAGVPLVTSDYGAVGDLAREFPAACHVFPSKLVNVDPQMPRFNSLYDGSQKWGGYEVRDLGAAMRECFNRGKRLHGERVREAFSMQACLPALKEALASVFEKDLDLLDAWGLR